MLGGGGSTAFASLQKAHKVHIERFFLNHFPWKGAIDGICGPAEHFVWKVVLKTIEAITSNFLSQFEIIIQWFVGVNYASGTANSAEIRHSNWSKRKKIHVSRLE